MLPTPSISKYISSILLLLLSIGTACAQLQDSTVSARPGAMPDTGDTVPVIVADTNIIVQDTGVQRTVSKTDSVHQFRIGIDVGRFLLEALSDDSMSGRKELGIMLDYYFRKELYFVLEGGWGSGYVDYPDLKYDTHNFFVKAGIDKTILLRARPNDWDQTFLGIRYAVAGISRSDAYYQTIDKFWGNTSGTIPGRNITGHWLEITAGTRLEVYKQIFIGWNVRGKFRVYRKPFEELPPYYIAGYGQGDKNAIFDFNFYLSYAIRWKNR